MEEEEAENMHGQQQSSLAAQMAAEEAEAEAMLKTKMFVFIFSERIFYKFNFLFFIS